MTPVKKRIGLFVVMVSVALFANAALACAQTMSPNSPNSAELVETPAVYDGTEIEFTGEVIGEAMRRGEWTWIHINDDAYYLQNVEEGAKLDGYNSGMAVYIPTELVEPIQNYGDYKHEGDVVTVVGVFNAACPEHGGDMDIHATRLVVNVPGRPVVDVVETWKLLLAAAMSVAAAVLFALHIRGRDVAVAERR